MDSFFILASVTIVFGPWILAIVALVKAGAARHANGQTREALVGLSRQLDTLRAELAALRDSGPAGAPRPPAADAAAPAEEADAAPEPVERPAVAPPPSPEPPTYSRPWDRAAAPAAAPAVARPAATRPESLEEALTSRWMVWLGAVVVALGSVFLVKFAIDQGYLGPAVRDTLTLLLGGALIAGGEWLRRRPLQREIAAIRPNYVPLALTAAGVFAGFASIYAAHVLHGLLGPLPAFAGLALVALAAVGLSLLQGRFVALLGLLGAFATPALITTADPSLWALLTYLLVVQLACLAVVRYQAWWSLGFATLAAATLWPLWIGLFLSWSDAQVVPMSLYLVLTSAAFLSLRYQAAPLTAVEKQYPLQVGLIRRRPYDALAWGAGVLTALLTFAVIHGADFSTPSLLLLATLAALHLTVGRTTPALEGYPVIAVVLVLAAMATWPVPGAGYPPDAFAVASFAFGALFGIGGFAALWGAERPALWAAISISVPLALLINAYGHIADFTANPRWVALALGLGAISLLAAARVVLYRSAYGLSLSLGFYAAGVVAFVTLAATMVVEQAWLTVAISVELLALAWIYSYIAERSLEQIAAILAGAVLVRLVVNPHILDYALIETPLFSWVVYGYGLPALAFFGAAKLFRDAGMALLKTLLQTGGLVFSVLLVSFEIRLLIAGSLDNPHFNLLEQSLHSIAWLAIGTGLLVRDQTHPNVIAMYGARVLLLGAAAQVVFLQLIYSNPLHTGEFVGGSILFNTLFLAYAAPAAFAFFLARRLQRQAPLWPAALAATLGFALTFIYLSAEVRHAFHGPILSAQPYSDTEFYTYSLVWLVYALALLAIGIAGKSTAPRYASLAVLLLTVSKAFLFDMGDLSGLLRVSTFLILGLTLIGIGYVYQRYVFRLPATAPVDGTGAAGNEA